MYKYVAKYFIPSKVFKFCNLTALPAFVIGIIAFLLSSNFVIYSLPADIEQQEIYRILFIHVPSAILSELIYLFLAVNGFIYLCLLYTSPSPRDCDRSRMPSSA